MKQKIRVKKKGNSGFGYFSKKMSSKWQFEVHQDHQPAWFEITRIKILNHKFINKQYVWFLFDKMFART